MALYKSVLHHSGNETPLWFLEALGVLVSLRNDCAYCVEHHTTGLRRVLRDDTRAQAIHEALASSRFSLAFTPAEAAALAYAETLTLAPRDRDALARAVDAMRASGYEDGCILEVNQVVAYFNYANRTVLGLGVTTAGDTLGLSPTNTAEVDDWSHL